MCKRVSLARLRVIQPVGFPKSSRFMKLRCRSSKSAFGLRIVFARMWPTAISAFGVKCVLAAPGYFTKATSAELSSIS